MTYRIELTPEKQRAVKAAASIMGITVEAFITLSAATNATVVLSSAAQRNQDHPKLSMDVQRLRVRAARGKYAQLKDTSDDLLKDRREEAAREMQKEAV